MSGSKFDDGYSSSWSGEKLNSSDIANSYSCDNRESSPMMMGPRQPQNWWDLPRNYRPPTMYNNSTMNEGAMDPRVAMMAEQRPPDLRHPRIGDNYMMLQNPPSSMERQDECLRPPPQLPRHTPNPTYLHQRSLNDDDEDDEIGYSDMPHTSQQHLILQRESDRQYISTTTSSGGGGGSSYGGGYHEIPRPVSYSHNMPDLIPEVILDNDRLRRKNLGSSETLQSSEPLMPTAMIESWIEEQRLIQFTVSEIPTYYATWTTENKFDWVIWSVPNITGIALLNEKNSSQKKPSPNNSGLINSNFANQDDHALILRRNALSMLFRTNLVQLTILNNPQHARSLLQYLHDLKDQQNRAMYLYIGHLPPFIEAHLSANNNELPFMNATTLSLYQKILSNNASQSTNNTQPPPPPY